MDQTGLGGGGQDAPPLQVETEEYVGWVRRARFRVQLPVPQQNRGGIPQQQNPGGIPQQQNPGGNWVPGQDGQRQRRQRGPLDMNQARIFASQQQQARVQQKRQALQPQIQTALNLQNLPDDLDNVQQDARQLLLDVQQAENQGRFFVAERLLQQAQPLLNRLVAHAEKGQAQQQRHDDLTGIFADVQRTYFKPGLAALNQEAVATDPSLQGKIKDATELQRHMQYSAFLDALGAVEQDRSANNLAALEKEASEYLAFCQKNPGVQPKPQEEAQRLAGRETNCRTALKQVLHWRMAVEYAAVPAPPWDELTEGKVGEMRARVILEQGYLDGKTEAKGVSGGSWWLQDVEWGDTPGQNRERKQMLFKASDLEADIVGFPKGGSAPREALGKTVNDTLKAMTGLDFGVPETQMIEVDSSRLPHTGGQTAKEAGLGDKLLGSAQQFSAAQGELADLVKQDPTLIGRIPPTVTQKCAILDVVSLNMDRHFGNFMVGQPNQDGSFDLVPIDQGLVLPTREGLLARATKFGPGHNAVSSMPGSDQPFDNEMKAHVRMIDPEEIERALRSKFDALKQQHPGANLDQALSDESFTMARRSAEFLKYAAEQDLTVNEIYNALAVENVNLLLCTDEERDERFRTAALEAKQRGPAARQFAAMDDNQKNQLLDDLQRLGWGVDLMDRKINANDFDNWMLANAPDALRLSAGNLENPTARPEIEATLKKLDYPPGLLAKLAKLNTGKQLIVVRNWAKSAGSKTTAVVRTRDSNKLNASFKLDVENEENIALMRELQACFPGKEKKNQVPKNGTEDEKREALYRAVALHHGQPDPQALQEELKVLFPELRLQNMQESAAALKQAREMKALLKQTALSMARIEEITGTSEHFTPMKIVGTLRNYLEYQKLGGDQMFARMGGDGDAGFSSRIAFIRLRTNEERAKQMPPVPPSDPTAAIEAHLERKLEEYFVEMTNFGPNIQHILGLNLTLAQDRLTQGDLVGAGEALADVAKEMKGKK